MGLKDIIALSKMHSGYKFERSEALAVANRVNGFVKAAELSRTSEEREKTRQKGQSLFDYSELLESRRYVFEEHALGDYTVKVERLTLNVVRFSLITNNIEILKTAFEIACEFLVTPFRKIVHSVGRFSFIDCDGTFFTAQDEFEIVRALEESILFSLRTVRLLTLIYESEVDHLIRAEAKAKQFAIVAGLTEEGVWKEYGYEFLAKEKVREGSNYTSGTDVLELAAFQHFPTLRIHSDISQPLLDLVHAIVSDDPFWDARVFRKDDDSILFAISPLFASTLLLKKLALFVYTDKLLLLIAEILTKKDVWTLLLAEQDLSKVICDDRESESEEGRLSIDM